MSVQSETREIVAIPQRVIDIVTDKGIPFRVAYGNRPYSTGELAKFPTVAFYDARYKMESPVHAHGQFVSDVSIETLLECPTGWPLDLDGGQPNWYIDASAMTLVKTWLVHIFLAQ